MNQIDFTKCKLSIVVPVYNEIKTLADILERIQQVKMNKEIILVDDGSTDGSREFIKQYGEKNCNCTALFHDKNRGKSAALRTGFAHVHGNIVVIQDADLEYDPRDYHRLITPILEGKADVVFGSRFLGGPHRVLYFWHYVANKLLTTISNMFTNVNLTDMSTCYKIFRVEVLEGLELKSNRFGFEPEFTAKIAKKKLRLYEVPISYYGRDYSQGKKVSWKDGLHFLWCILRYNLLE